MIEIDKLIPFNCNKIKWSDDNLLCTIWVIGKGFCVIDAEGNIVLDFGIYDFIDGFTWGYAKVRKGNKWGIINIVGQIVLPIEYDKIWNFYKRDYPYVEAYKYSKEFRKCRYKKNIKELLMECKIKRYDEINTFWLVQREEKKHYCSDKHHEHGVDYIQDTWFAMTDGMCGDMPDGFDGDFDSYR